MNIVRYTPQLQAAYSELIEQLHQAELHNLSLDSGSFARRRIKEKYYWYFRRRAGSRIEERYLGAESPKLLARIEEMKVRAADAKAAAKARRQLIRQLSAGGYSACDRRTGRVLEELARAGVFRLEGVLVGTHAFRCYSGLLGVKLETRLAATSDIDIAQDATVSLAISESANPVLADALASAERFLEIPALDPKAPTSGWQTPDRQLRVDLLTPLVGRQRSGTRELPVLGASAKALRFLDFLLADTARAVVLTGSGVLVRVPTPERYALHKLIVAQRRAREAPDKVGKDLAQAEALLTVLLADFPDHLMDAWTELVKRGRNWRSDAVRSLKRLPEAIREPMLDVK